MFPARKPLHVALEPLELRTVRLLEPRAAEPGNLAAWLQVRGALEGPPLAPLAVRVAAWSTFLFGLVVGSLLYIWVL